MMLNHLKSRYILQIYCIQALYFSLPFLSINKTQLKIFRYKNMLKIQFFRYSLFTYLFGISTAFAATDTSLEDTIQAVNHGFKTQNTQLVKQFIHPKYGFIYWNKIGVPTNQSFYTRAEFEFPKYEGNGSNMWFYEAPDANQKLIQTTQLPTMDCTSWNKSGLFYTANRHKPFSELSKFNQSIHESSKQELKTELKQIVPFEKQLVELQYVGTSKSIGDDMHLFFSKIDGKWYFSALDNAGTCDA